MTMTEKIIESVRDSKLTASQIITQLDAKSSTVKSTLHRLVKDERVLRVKEAVRSGRGPQQVFVYYTVNKAEQENTNQSAAKMK